MENVLVMKRGNTLRVDLELSGTGILPIQAGYSFTFNARPAPSVAPVITATRADGGVLVTDANLGKISLILYGPKTSSLPNTRQEYMWDLDLVDNTGQQYTIVSGDLIIRPNV
jgi:hypothetical protein